MRWRVLIFARSTSSKTFWENGRENSSGENLAGKSAHISGENDSCHRSGENQNMVTKVDISRCTRPGNNMPVS